MFRTTRARKLAVIGLLLLGVVGAVIGGAAWYLFDKLDEQKAKLASLIIENPGSTAVVAYTIDDEGEIVDDGNAIFYNADQPLVMASTVKIVVLAAYAEAVAGGSLDPNERVPIADVEQYYLPGTDGGAHVMGLNSLGLDADEAGFAVDRAAGITLDDLARIMIHYSGNAETDYLIMRLGADRIASVMLEAGLEHHTPIRPIIGGVLAMFNHEVASPSMDQLQQVIADVSRGDTGYLDHLTDMYLNDPEWRQAQIEFTQSIDENTFAGLDVWAYQTEASLLLPQGTAREYAQMMARIAGGSLISTEVSQILQQMLESVPSDWPLRALYFDRFGAKDGVTAGVLTLAAYALPKRGPLSNQSRVVVIITNWLPPEAWAEQLQYQGHYLLAIDLAEAKGVYYKWADTGVD